MIPSTAFATPGLIENRPSDRLGAEILDGSLTPSECIVEGKWVARPGVAQPLVRPAMTLPAQAGFVSKARGRSARMIHLREAVVLHVGDMGQIHRHRVLFSHVALDRARYFPEQIPHLRERFVFPAQVGGGVDKTAQGPCASVEMLLTREGR
jgi:hypothetical protein